MRRAIPFAALLLVAGSVLARQEGSRPLAGFSSQEAQAEQQWEQKFRAIPSADNLREFRSCFPRTRTTSALPTTSKTANGWAAKFKEWGWDVHVETSRCCFRRRPTASSN